MLMKEGRKMEGTLRVRDCERKAVRLDAANGSNRGILNNLGGTFLQMANHYLESIDGWRSSRSLLESHREGCYAKFWSEATDESNIAIKNRIKLGVTRSVEEHPSENCDEMQKASNRSGKLSNFPAPAQCLKFPQQLKEPHLSPEPRSFHLKAIGSNLKRESLCNFMACSLPVINFHSS
ncbi:hypothetical protein RRG08_034891 [Elysia crispata]|uniref:Uncharacterized protein n=1 Tax=Elysia crispata TaxID=231223 RepID=A0AAE0ZSX9_9GAST|nr:hypothetical protein RRG08_034891 [Elysia crispata]